MQSGSDTISENQNLSSLPATDTTVVVSDSTEVNDSMMHHLKAIDIDTTYSNSASGGVSI